MTTFHSTKNDIAKPHTAAFVNYLCEQKLLNANNTAHIRSVLNDTKAPLDVALSRLGLISEDSLASCYASYFQTPRWEGASTKMAPQDLKKINRAFLERHRILPLHQNAANTTLAIVDPFDTEGIEGMKFALGADIQCEIFTATEFDQLFAEAFAEEANDQASVVDEPFSTDDAAMLKDLAGAEPAVRLVNRLISDAARARASDIHVEPKEREVHVRRRIDGVLTASESLSRAQGLSAISRLKILAGLDIAERRRPQDGRLTFPVGGRPIDMRISTTPTIHGESVVIRLLEKPVASLGLDSLGFSPSQGAVLKRLSMQPNGILLITGPTGSGKTTTLYALLEMLAKRELKILTIEDPVEYKIDGVSQTQVHPAIGLNFASAMRSFLRHDPDVIMVGEMRDLETARTAVQAALTGHLVLSTLHTNDAPSAITRLLDMGLEDYLVGSTLLGVAAQRLVRRACTSCHNTSPMRDSCDQCHGEGYVGRLAVSEVLNIDDRLQSRLHTGVTAAELKEAAVQNGFVSMLEDGEAKAEAGLTTNSELKRVLGAGDDAA